MKQTNKLKVPLMVSLGTQMKHSNPILCEAAVYQNAYPAHSKQDALHQLTNKQSFSASEQATLRTQTPPQADWHQTNSSL